MNLIIKNLQRNGDILKAPIGQTDIKRTSNSCKQIQYIRLANLKHNKHSGTAYWQMSIYMHSHADLDTKPRSKI